MRYGIQTEARRFSALMLFSLLIGILFEAPLEFFLLALSVYLIWFMRKGFAIFRWAEGGMRGAPPFNNGAWIEVIRLLERLKQLQRRSKEKLRFTVKRVRRMTKSLDQGMVILNGDLSLDWWNRSAESLLGFRRTDRGSPITNFVRHPDFIKYVSKARFKEPLRIPSGSEPNVQLEFFGSNVGQGEIVLIVTDITELDNLESMRREFVENVSHELRTPLTVIKGYVETLRDLSDVPKSEAKVLAQISLQVEKMEALADDLALLSRLESETPPQPINPVKLKPLLSGIVNDAKRLSAGKHVIKLDCDNRVEILGNANELRSAFSNIVFNAVNHNPKGANINIHAGEDANFLNVSIRDDGVGIDLPEIPRITERFYRVDASRNSHSGGTGLGLAIVKHTLNRYNGSLIVSSRIGEGAEFLCKLPRT